MVAVQYTMQYASPISTYTKILHMLRIIINNGTTVHPMGTARSKISSCCYQVIINQSYTKEYENHWSIFFANNQIEQSDSHNASYY